MKNHFYLVNLSTRQQKLKNLKTHNYGLYCKSDL